MVIKTHSLHSFSAEKNELLNILTAKIASAKFTGINAGFDSKYTVALNPVKELLDAVESKFRRCEMLFVAYFENVDHNILSGSSSSLPYELGCTFVDLSSTIKHNYAIDDKTAYKEMIDLNFQNFILTLASLYENLVLLTEIFIKKVMVYIKKPLSSPLHDYLEYLKRLIDLGYRQNDKLNICMNSFNTFFTKYLEQINKLRNKFIHGYSINLYSDGYYYFVEKMDKTSFSPTSPELILDQFSKHVLDNTKNFITDLLIALKESTKHYKKSIPA